MKKLKNFIRSEARKKVSGVKQAIETEEKISIAFLNHCFMHNMTLPPPMTSTPQTAASYQAANAAEMTATKSRETAQNATASKAPKASVVGKAPVVGKGPQKQPTTAQSMNEPSAEEPINEQDPRPLQVRSLQTLLDTKIEGCNYRIIGKIGEGTFSSVYKAVDLEHVWFENAWTSTTPSRPMLVLNPPRSTAETGGDLVYSQFHYVAIKRIYPNSSPTRIANEIRILSELKYVLGN